MNSFSGAEALGLVQSALAWVRNNGALVAILLALGCIFYLRQMSRRLDAIGKTMNDVRWISAKPKQD